MYQVSVTYPFTFLTPLAATIMGPSLNLGASSSSLVMNSAVLVASPTLSVTKSSTTTNVTAAGQVVPYSYLVINTGNVLVTGIAVADNNVDSPGVTCPATLLSVGNSMTCTASHTVTTNEMNGRDRKSVV